MGENASDSVNVWIFQGIETKRELTYNSKNIPLVFLQIFILKHIMSQTIYIYHFQWVQNINNHVTFNIYECFLFS